MRYRASPSPNIAVRSFGDEIVAADFPRGVYFSMLGSAAQIWEGLIAGIPLDRVITDVSALSDADPRDFVEAARAFVDSLLAEKLIVPGEPSVPGAWKPSPPAGERYGLPLLERFTDMEDLLRLDPIHETEPSGWPDAGTAPSP